jgi:dihydrofolate reductase
MRVTMYLGLSVDGFVARADDALDFLDTDPGEVPADLGFGEFLATVDVMVMGRRTFDVVRSFGPEAWHYGDLPIVVLSRSLAALPEGTRPSVRLASGSPAEIVAAYPENTHVYVDGAATAQAFLAAGLVTDLVLTWVPVLIGDGIRLWGALPGDIRLERVDVRTLPSGMVQVRYRVQRTVQPS